MPSLTLPDRLIWFAHVPKAGGTSVEQLMVARWGDRVGHLHWGWDLWWKNGGWRRADPPNSPQHLTWDGACAALGRSPTHVFAVVRDPAQRMISEYHWQRHARRGTRAGRALSHLPFSLWLRLMLAMARIHPHAFDNHFRGQGDFIPEGARVFRLEEGLQTVADWLAETTGEAGLTMPHALKGKAPPQKALTPTDLAQIARAYEQDYRRFGYPLPDMRHPDSDTLARWLASLVAPPLLWLERRGAL